MGNFVLWIEQPLDMSVQRLHHRDLREHRRTAAGDTSIGASIAIAYPEGRFPSSAGR
jgi:hypothetical protein